MEFDSFYEFYENKILRYKVDKPGRKLPTKNEVLLIIEYISAAKAKM